MKNFIVTKRIEAGVNSVKNRKVKEKDGRELEVRDRSPFSMCSGSIILRSSHGYHTHYMMPFDGALVLLVSSLTGEVGRVVRRTGRYETKTSNVASIEAAGRSKGHVNASSGTNRSHARMRTRARTRQISGPKQSCLTNATPCIALVCSMALHAPATVNHGSDARLARSDE